MENCHMLFIADQADYWLTISWQFREARIEELKRAGFIVGDKDARMMYGML